MKDEIIFTKAFLLIRILCVLLYFSTTLSASDDSSREFFEDFLRIPNSEKTRNSVVDRLERALQQQLAARQRAVEEDCEEPAEILPEYTESIQGSQERGVRQLSSQKHYPICHLKRKIRRLNTNDYEYRPAYYEEVRCVPADEDVGGATYEICSSLGFSCVQWNKTIHLTRRRYSSDCWETKTMIIPAGCECMWPVHRLGDMASHSLEANPTNASD